MTAVGGFSRVEGVKKRKLPISFRLGKWVMEDIASFFFVLGNLYGIANILAGYFLLS